MDDLYQASSSNQSDIASRALAHVNLLEGHIADTMRDNANLASNWLSDASTQFVDATMKKLLQKVESVKGVCHAYHGAANTCSDLTSSTEQKNLGVVSL